jgi:predicted RNA-binding protein associated with RNAse of E/G family
MDDQIVVEKLDLAGNTSLSYRGRVVAREETAVVLEAPYTFARRELGYVTLEPGDRFVEHFYTDRWYNVFVIYDGQTGALKGWYCNVTRPAEIAAAPEGGLVVRAVDLALDFFVQPSGKEFVLDEDEFAALSLAPGEAAAALSALDELRRLAASRAGPFAAAAQALT